MENVKDEYHLSFFKPTTPHAKANRNLAIVLISIWAVAVFGFQILLRIIEKPVAEPTLTEFEEVLPAFANGSASDPQQKIFSQNCLSVLSKVFIAAPDQAILQDAFTASFFKLLPEEDKTIFMERLTSFKALQSEINDIHDQKYIEERDKLNADAITYLGMQANDVRAQMIAHALKPDYKNPETADDYAAIHASIKKYTVHNQSFLTDAKFIGFPFHYFYTAVFLLVLFVFLCWLYCIRTDANHKKLSLNEHM